MRFPVNPRHFGLDVPLKAARIAIDFIFSPVCRVRWPKCGVSY
jgi:hypothetical protein